MLSTFGDVDAVEHDAGARTIAAQRSGLEVLPCTLPHDLPVSDYTYDLIALLDVLEHIDDDQATLTSLREKLANAGQLIVTVPALPWLWSHHDIINHHKRRYTIRNLSAAANRAGFCVDQIGYFNCLLLPIAVVRRLISIAFHRSIEDDRMPSPPINFILREIFSLERFVITHLKFPIGLSIFAILKPQNRGANSHDVNPRSRLAK